MSANFLIQEVSMVDFLGKDSSYLFQEVYWSAQADITKWSPVAILTFASMSAIFDKRSINSKFLKIIHNF